MIDQNKINQVYAAIIENGIDAFQDTDLVKLFSMLNRFELEEAENTAYNRFYEKYNSDAIAYQSSKRVSSIMPLLKYNINDKLYKIRKTNIIEYMNQSLLKQKYHEFFNKCETNELMDIKYYLSNNVNMKDPNNVSATKKLISMILKELNSRVGKFN